MMIDNKELVVRGTWLKIACLKDEWFDHVEDPGTFVGKLKAQGIRADLLTFWQNLPETRPLFPYRWEVDPVAVIPVSSFEHWFNHQIERSSRKAVRKAEKSGVFVKVVELHDEFLRGVLEIFNETPLRQGRPYENYGKDAATVKADLEKDRHRSDFIGAYVEQELVGFIQLGCTGIAAIPFGMVSKIAHRDKAPQNALLAKAIEVCEQKGIPYLLYGKWLADSLGDFKRHNGCEKVDLPRYYVPLSLKGALALKLGLHHGLSAVLPEGMKNRLKELRKKWYSRTGELKKAPSA